MENSQVLIKEGKENMNIPVIHQFLSEQSYWAKGISYTFVDNSLTNCFNVGAFVDGQQIGFEDNHGFLRLAGWPISSY